MTHPQPLDWPSGVVRISVKATSPAAPSVNLLLSPRLIQSNVVQSREERVKTPPAPDWAAPILTCASTSGEGAQIASARE
jgi:hypothetical protein